MNSEPQNTRKVSSLDLYSFLDILHRESFSKLKRITHHPSYGFVISNVEDISSRVPGMFSAEMRFPHGLSNDTYSFIKVKHRLLKNVVNPSNLNRCLHSLQTLNVEILKIGYRTQYFELNLPCLFTEHIYEKPLGKIEQVLPALQEFSSLQPWLNFFLKVP